MTTWEEVPLPDEFVPKPLPDGVIYTEPSQTLDDLASKLGWFPRSTLLPEPVQGELFE